MTEQQALSMSTGQFGKNLVGYLPVDAAFYLVSTGRYEFFRTTDAGHVLKKAAELEEDWLGEAA